MIEKQAKRKIFCDIQVIILSQINYVTLDFTNKQLVSFACEKNDSQKESQHFIGLLVILGRISSTWEFCNSHYNQ